MGWLVSLPDAAPHAFRRFDVRDQADAPHYSNARGLGMRCARLSLSTTLSISCGGISFGMPLRGATRATPLRVTKTFHACARRETPHTYTFVSCLRIFHPSRALCSFRRDGASLSLSDFSWTRRAWHGIFWFDRTGQAGHHGGVRHATRQRLGWRRHVSAFGRASYNIISRGSRARHFGTPGMGVTPCASGTLVRSSVAHFLRARSSRRAPLDGLVPIRSSYPPTYPPSCAFPMHALLPCGTHAFLCSTDRIRSGRNF